ncbi:S24 family peptidase [Sphingomonas adhaesiva]|uniref:S24 family peptidase n=1 Tax=Sphingomonas adhaesiva TaxID=28212 RepID=UPI002FF703BD
MADDPRQALAALAQARGVSLSALSRMLGRNVAYLQQFVGRGSPRVLPERDRRMLADFLGVEDAALGGPAAAPPAEVTVPWLDVSAAAGSGRSAEGERVIRAVALPAAMLRQLGVTAAQASMIRVAGESMMPTLMDGDRLLVDVGERRVPAGGGLFVIRREDGVAVKRLVPRGGTIEIVSDNPAFDAVTVKLAEIEVIGRARLLLRDV